MESPNLTVDTTNLSPSGPSPNNVATPSSAHKQSRGSMGLASAGGLRKSLASDFDFNIQNAKAKVYRVLAADENVPGPFKKFFNTPLYDRLINALLLYFTTRFQNEWLTKAMDKARKQHLEGYNPYQVAAKLQDLEEEQEQQKVEISPIYSEIILKHSNFQKPQQDRIFFESLYETLIALLDDAFSKLNKRADIEREMGLLFRSRHFNLYKRKNQPPRSVDTLSVKELYTIKHETTNRALNAKLLSSLYEKPVNLGVQVASVTNSPLITNFIQSPIVARSLMKDPEAREKLFQSLREQNEDTPGHKLSNVFKGVAQIKGVDTTNLKQEIRKLKPTESGLASVGIVTEAGDRRSRRTVNVPGLLAPEAVGLPLDDGYNYLALLKRYILYGPSLGLGSGGMMPGMYVPPAMVPYTPSSKSNPGFKPLERTNSNQSGQ